MKFGKLPIIDDELITQLMRKIGELWPMQYNFCCLIIAYTKSRTITQVLIKLKGYGLSIVTIIYTKNASNLTSRY